MATFPQNGKFAPLVTATMLSMAQPLTPPAGNTATVRQQVTRAYRATEAEARTASPLRLRWMARRALRRAEGGDQRDLARLAAIRSEFQRRGEELPSR